MYMVSAWGSCKGMDEYICQGGKEAEEKNQYILPLCEIPQDFSLCIISEYLPKEMWYVCLIF